MPAVPRLRTNSPSPISNLENQAHQTHHESRRPPLAYSLAWKAKWIATVRFRRGRRHFGRWLATRRLLSTDDPIYEYRLALMMLWAVISELSRIMSNGRGRAGPAARAILAASYRPLAKRSGDQSCTIR